MSRENKIWLIGSGVAIVVGSLLPWINAGLFSFSGTDGDGVFTLIMGGLIALIGIQGKTTKTLAIGAVGLAVFSGLIAWNVFSGVMGQVDTSDLIAARPGGGLYLVGLGALFAVGAGSKTWSEAKAQEQKEASVTQTQTDE